MKMTAEQKLASNRCSQRKYQKSPAGKIRKAEDAKKYQATPAGKETRKRGGEKYHLKYPEKIKAQSETGNAIRGGRLVRPSACSTCFESGFIEAHHEDYSKPLEIVWLCPRCHRKVHTRVLTFV